ncbi:NUDIX hydrolase [Agrococcus sp. Marseille-Q4369]|uniref:NUDIX domain-containing protein n=1 Tax=Agrococcus sp. Marseille-Q4369 TaxID=2810513 RepID=UPI001B8C673D|nr:NUDIX hydrolase [Agrococcus sp. Marseille-Q4369]QUW19518.1 NUDIX hydrolase [Agrococcus sp. Marseille-Q4369]
MLEDALGRQPVLESEQLFSGRIWDVERQEFELGGERIVREVIVHPGAVAVVALNELGEVMLVHQYRHPAGGTLWELPAGLLDVEGEDPLAAARRELAEETDLEAASWRTLVDLSPSGGGSTEIIRVYLATDVRELPEQHARVHEEAAMERRWVPLEEVVEAALAMRLHNATLLSAVLALHAMRARGAEPHAADAPFDWHPAHRP